MLFVPCTESDYDIANSYLSVAEADEIITGQTGSSNWVAYTDEIKKILLMKSSVAVDGAMMYSGIKISSNQLLKFPRADVNCVSSDSSKKIPNNIRFAVALLSMQFSNNKAFENITSESISKLKWTFKESNDIGAEVMAFLKPLKATTVKIGGMYEKYQCSN